MAEEKPASKRPGKNRLTEALIVLFVVVTLLLLVIETIQNVFEFLG